MNRNDFPILSRTIYGKPLVYFDNGATTQKPLCVLDAMREEYLNVNANVHRGVHYLSQKATDLHEAARETVRAFINAASTSEIIFTRGTTESMNLVASSFTDAFMHEGDEVIISTMEHHSNIVPWQLQGLKKGIRLRVIPISDDGILDMDAYRAAFNDRTRLVSITHVSNVLGTVNPVKDIIRIAHDHDVPCLIDGAQSTPHLAIDVQDLDCDFFAFSGHKMYGPTGIGVLYGKEKYLDLMPPYQGGGEMIGTVTFEKTTYADLPFKFEAGTPDYVATHGLATAIKYMQSIGMDRITAHETDLTNYALQRLSEIEGMRIFGPLPSSQPVAAPSQPVAAPVPFSQSETASPLAAPLHDAVISFEVASPSGVPIHHLDLGTLLDRLGIAVRTGHHCAEPLMHRLGIPGTVRASFALYNTREEIDTLVAAIERVRKMF